MFGRFHNASEACYQVRVTTTLESLVAQMTVAELAQRSGRSISDVIELVLSSGNGVARVARATAAPATNGRKTPGRKAAATPAPAATGGRKKAQTRTQAGRASYDDAVLTAVKSSKGKVKAEDLRRKVGGTPPQLRAALARLIDSGTVKSAGKARGTTYASA
jgi:propanediol dehydratase large subunit